MTFFQCVDQTPPYRTDAYLTWCRFMHGIERSRWIKCPSPYFNVSFLSLPKHTLMCVRQKKNSNFTHDFTHDVCLDSQRDCVYEVSILRARQQNFNFLGFICRLLDRSQIRAIAAGKLHSSRSEKLLEDDRRQV